MSTSEQNRPGARRLWERNAAHERVGVDVAGPDGTVVIDVYEYSPPRGDYFLHFSASEWDEIVRVVADKRREMQTRRKT